MTFIFTTIFTTLTHPTTTKLATTETTHLNELITMKTAVAAAGAQKVLCREPQASKFIPSLGP